MSCPAKSFAGAIAATLLLGACSGELSTLDPAGPAASRIATLWWVMLGGAFVILLGVMGTAIYALRSAAKERNFSTRKVLIGWGLAFPIATLLALMAVSFLPGELLPRSPEENAIRAQAHQWFWTFDYPGGERTIDVLHVPAGEEFAIAITSEDVIHSFWIPRLGGKIDAVPGKVNHIRLKADRPGRYLATCAEYCGIGHAHMRFEALAHRPEDYAAALTAATDRAAARAPVLEQRDAPAALVIEEWGDYLLDWLGIT
ncbi:cytochrome c oxidase subunit II [Altericroceibacterium xinjiangense]|uniref:cytochrome c oxidase subunit II n=1 Tax=Altericroceibacterium xinjiangense TaxID=762261 RepID=UPI000F7ECA7E|nr:cytochrome c oxidase subunit II [Altericroceibacterium xinjiangense]